MRLLDRYILREILPPFVIALLVFTFILIIPFIIDMAEQLIAKGVPAPTLLRLTATLVPQALGLTIPMAFLLAILVGLGRLSGDREIVVMMACGVSPYRMLRPVLVAAAVCWAATSWVMIEAIPNENQNYREITMRIVADRAEGQVRAREFFEDFPDVVLYVREIPAGGGWQDVFAANTKNAAQPIIYVARRGRMVVDRQKKTIEMVLEDGARHTTKAAQPATYEVERFQQTMLSLNPESVFPRTGPARGDRELPIAELQAKVAEFQARGLPHHNQVIEIHKKFSIPLACFVFAVLGAALGISNRRDGKLASFVLGIGVIFVYYVIMFSAHAMTKGALLPAWLAMWVPNIVLGAAGLLLLVARARGVEGPLRFALPVLPWRKDAELPAQPGSAEASTTARAGRPPAAPRGGRRPHPPPPHAPAESARSLRRQAVRAHPGDGGRVDGRPVLHLDLPRSLGQVVQGADDACHAARVSRLGDAAVPVLHHRDCSAALGAHHHRPAHEEQRADRHARLRREPLSHGAAAARSSPSPPAAS